MNYLDAIDLLITLGIIVWIIPAFKWKTFPKKAWFWRIDVALWTANVAMDIYRDRATWVLVMGSLVLGGILIATIVSELGYRDWKKANPRTPVGKS